MDDAARGLIESGTRVPVAGFVLDLARQALIDPQGRPVDLRPQAYQVLRCLALQAGRLVGKDDLLAAVWPGVVVTDDSLVQAIGDIRRALGDAGHRAIKTVPRRGYVMLADAPVSDAASRQSPPASAQSPVASTAAASNEPSAGPRSRGNRLLVFACAALSLVAALFGAWWAVREPDAALAPAAIGGRPSIAVLAFTDPQHGEEGGLVARGVAQDLTSELARSHDLRVVSYQSSFAFAGQATPLAEIGRRLRSRYLVDGTVSREGESLRLAVQLLDSQDGHIVWSSIQLVDRSALFSAQDALVRRIAGMLQSRLHRTEEGRALTRPPRTMDVYTLTERGKATMHRYSAPAMVEARRLFEQALAIDSEYAPAWVFLGMVNTIDSGLRLTGGWHPGRMPEVLVQVRRAVALEPELPIAYVSLSQAQALARDFDAALAAAERCVELAPNDADCLYIMGKAKLELGDMEAAVHYMQQALDLNPISPAFLPAFHATALWGARRFDDAIRAADDCLAKAPDFWRCRQDRLASLVELGRLPEARAEASALLAGRPTLSAQLFAEVFADSAVALRERRVAAAVAAGVPLASAAK